MISRSAFLVVLLPLFVACGSGSKDDTQGTAAAESAVPTAKLGEHCGGDGDTPIANCAAGLECVETSNLEPGTCQKAKAKLGEHCGGEGDTPIAVCADGLVCVEKSDLEPGTCQAKAKAKLGEKCGGNGDEPIAICDDGLECFEPSDLEPGTCRKIAAK